MMDPAKTTLLIFMILLTFLSNLLSILSILLRGKVCRMYFFLLNLCVADMLTSVLTLTPELIREAVPGLLRPSSEIACKATKAAQMLAPYLRQA